MAVKTFKLGRYQLDRTRPQVMGILNITPDSFYCGSRINQLDNVLRQAEQMLAQGADILDIGGESSRPGAAPVPLELELERVMPVLEKLVGNFDCPISIDTYKPEVMRAAIEQGASMINDIYALRQPGAIDAVSNEDVAVCLMHMQKQPENMQVAPQYEEGGVVQQVKSFLNERITACLQAGISQDRILIDPGFGFGKTLEHNITLLRELMTLSESMPLLVGLSRKTMVGQLLDKSVEKRLYGSITLAALAYMHGAWIVRVHDVEATVDALKITTAVMSEG